MRGFNSMNEKYQATIELNSVSITISKKQEKKESITLAYDNSFEKSVQFLEWDSNSDVFYIEISNQSEDEKEEPKGINLTVEELKIFLKHGKKLIKQLKEKEFFEF